MGPNILWSRIWVSIKKFVFSWNIKKLLIKIGKCRWIEMKNTISKRRWPKYLIMVFCYQNCSDILCSKYSFNLYSGVKLSSISVFKNSSLFCCDSWNLKNQTSYNKIKHAESKQITNQIWITEVKNKKDAWSVHENKYRFHCWTIRNQFLKPKWSENIRLPIIYSHTFRLFGGKTTKSSPNKKWWIYSGCFFVLAHCTH